MRDDLSWRGCWRRERRSRSVMDLQLGGVREGGGGGGVWAHPAWGHTGPSHISPPSQIHITRQDIYFRNIYGFFFSRFRRLGTWGPPNEALLINVSWRNAHMCRLGCSRDTQVIGLWRHGIAKSLKSALQRLHTEDKFILNIKNLPTHRWERELDSIIFPVPLN